MLLLGGLVVPGVLTLVRLQLPPRARQFPECRASLEYHLVVHQSQASYSMQGVSDLV